MHFTDHILSNYFNEVQLQIDNNGIENILLDADQNRWSGLPLERAKSAVSYSALAIKSVSHNDWQKAAYYWHFAGHSFRTVWMDSKAGYAYLRSAECGSKAAEALDTLPSLKQRRFDLRSLGRARVCFSASGQVWRLPEVDELINATISEVNAFRK